MFVYFRGRVRDWSLGRMVFVHERGTTDWMTYIIDLRFHCWKCSPRRCPCHRRSIHRLRGPCNKSVPQSDAHSLKIASSYREIEDMKHGAWNMEHIEHTSHPWWYQLDDMMIYKWNSIIGHHLHPQKIDPLIQKIFAHCHRCLIVRIPE